MHWIYLDNNATTQPAKEVLDAMQETYERFWANPSSVHRLGQAVRQRVELARARVAKLIHCRDRELVFTSGGTESNNLALRGVLDRAAFARTPSTPPRGVLITTGVEHPAIRQPAQALAQQQGTEVVDLPVDRHGRITPDQIVAAIQSQARTAGVVLVSVQWANNETGVIQPIEPIAQACHQARSTVSPAQVLLHVDATQAVGKIPVDVGRVPVDLLTLSAHKFHGPKGVGALYIRHGVRLWPQIRGGVQERERRGGTENTAGIVGMGAAAELAQRFLADPNRATQLAAMRDRFEQGVLDALPQTVIHAHANGHTDGLAPQRLWNTSNLGFAHLASEAILVGLSERGLCASAGAACSSGSLEPSPVLLAMGVPEAVAHGSVRFSLSRFTTDPQITQAVQIVTQVVKKIARTLPTPA